MVVGKAPAPVEARLRELGAAVVPSPAHPLSGVSPWSNKLVALQEPSDDPVLLVDNDVCFLEDVSDIRGRKLRTTICGRARVSDEQWEYIRQATGLEPIRQDWVSLQAELKAKRLGREPKVERSLYFAAGVAWFRDPADFAPLWANGTDAIMKAFEGHPLSSFRVYGCDQVGFAVAAAQHGGLDLLPPTYNHRPMCFRARPAGPEDPAPGRARGLEGRDDAVLAAPRPWWERRILKPIGQLDRDGAPMALARGKRRSSSTTRPSLRDRVLALGRDADLDSFDFSTAA